MVALIHSNVQEGMNTYDNTYLGPYTGRCLIGDGIRRGVFDWLIVILNHVILMFILHDIF